MAHRDQIRVTFDPARLAGDPFVFDPDQLDIPLGSTVELSLRTLGDGSRQARFADPAPLVWARPEQAASFSQESRSADGTRLELRSQGRRAGGPVSYAYHVVAEYGGVRYTSGGWPTIIQHDPVG